MEWGEGGVVKVGCPPRTRPFRAVPTTKGPGLGAGHRHPDPSTVYTPSYNSDH